MRRRSPAVMLVMVIALVAAGCGDDGDDDEAAGTTTTAESSSSTTAGSAGEGNELSVVAEDFSFSGAPEEIEAGVFDITFENVGQVEHELAFVEIGDTPIGEVGAALAPAVEGGPFPEFLENLTTPTVAEAGDTIDTTALLAEGNYALICTFDGAVAEPGATTTTAAEGAPPDDGPTGPPHYELGMIQPLTITASDAELVLPEAESTVTASDYAFDVDVKAGTQTVNFVNEGPAQVHHAVFFAFNEGVDEAAADMALQTFLASQDPAAPPGPPPPEIDLTAVTPEFGLFSTGLGATYEAEFEAGRTYAAVCFIQDRTGGPPHVVAHDMKEIFTVE